MRILRDGYFAPLKCSAATVTIPRNKPSVLRSAVTTGMIRREVTNERLC